uniref:Similar to GRV2 (KATAMARI2) n=1 Tax=Arundo donax TaxID=35708 RepID=A0A0A9DR60_ARUDO
MLAVPCAAGRNLVTDHSPCRVSAAPTASITLFAINSAAVIDCELSTDRDNPIIDLAVFVNSDIITVFVQPEAAINAFDFLP